MAEGYQCFAVPGTFLDGDVPFGGDRGQDAQSLRRVGPGQMGEMAEGAAMVQVIGGVMSGQRHCLQGERRGDKQQYRERP